MDPTPKDVSVAHSVTVECSQKSLWALISSPGSLTRYHPYCEHNPVERWPGVGSQDRVFYTNGLILTCTWVSWLENEGYDLDTRADNDDCFRVAWRIGASPTAAPA